MHAGCMKTNIRSLFRLASWPRAIGIAIGLAVAVGVILTAFAWPAVRSAPHDVPVGVAGPSSAASQVAQRLDGVRPGAFEIHRYADRSAAEAAIRDRDVYGAVVLAPAGPPSVLTASAASPAVATALGEVAQSLGEPPASGPGVVEAVDVVPTTTDDPHGIGIALSPLPLIIGAILSAVLLGAAVGSLRARVTGSLLFAALGGLVSAAVLQSWLGSLAGSYLANAAVLALGLAAISLTMVGLRSLAGAKGLAAGAVTMVLLGNPLSGLNSAPELLPIGWGTVGQLLPPGATGQLLKSVAFFDGARATGPLVVLLAWAASGLLLTAAARSRGEHAAAAHSAEPQLLRAAG